MLVFTHNEQKMNKHLVLSKRIFRFVDMKSKAKRIDNREWVEGWYFRFNDVHHISTGTEMIEINPNTLCMQIRGTELFEGDEVQSGATKGVIKYKNNEQIYFVVQFIENEDSHLYFPIGDSWTPTGKNIYDND